MTSHASLARARRLALGPLLLATVVIVSGCVDLESSVVFNKDLTGKATIALTMDFSAFVNSMAKTIAARSGGAPKEIVSELKKELGDRTALTASDIVKLKQSMPAGVTLVDWSEKLDELKIVVTFAFAFTDATKLPLIKLPPPQVLGGADSLIVSKTLNPFDSLLIVSDDATMSITTKPKGDTPATGPEVTRAEALTAMSQAKAQLESQGMGDALKSMGLRIAMRFQMPQSVIEHNATGKEGDAYVWEVKIDNFASLDKPPDLPVVKLKFSRK